MKLIKDIENIYDEAKPLVEKRWQEFVELGKRGSEKELFSELSFCVLTANWSAKGGIKAQKEIGVEGFVNLNIDELEYTLKKVGHRFPSKRAQYIVSNRWIIGTIRHLFVLPYYQVREFLVKNIKGIGWKEASHFLRNVGYGEVAILDKHILRLMLVDNLIDSIPKGWTKKRYLDYEKRLKVLEKYFNEPIGKLDLYLWYLVKKDVDK
ncbi:N-glycosylase/DNA lyase [Marinitoga hydrogenitolerans DSM 16785]|uniref:8-oxoguanine DNA glycosylase/AP lyase n=1 Tax=Marinitoga hydrogenitolerans (strain DSM 16785 / JCM 12826 / AT1271) TaxID=1122195 RepID=A0A1M5AIK5_MARH1|nr:N-glycosylase/DNA lyase [Marinitoga hydrogenitolerans]SHF29956.1 N-glycosylase/DNA lyase [Marinitoga hydrogenitolerans DSM 16785]